MTFESDYELFEDGAFEIREEIHFNAEDYRCMTATSSYEAQGGSFILYLKTYLIR